MAFYALEKLVNLQDGYQKAFQVAGKSLLLIQNNGTTFLLENSCPHMGVPLTAATQTPDGFIRCNAHGIEFELDSGNAIGPLANTLECLTKFEPIYEGSHVGVEL